MKGTEKEYMKETEKETGNGLERNELWEETVKDLGRNCEISIIRRNWERTEDGSYR